MGWLNVLKGGFIPMKHPVQLKLLRKLRAVLWPISHRAHVQFD